jgi:mono/diheme cytochrome c family protein
MAVPSRRKRWSGPAAEAALVLVVLGLLFVAALAVFMGGRHSAHDDSPAAAQTETQGGTTASEAATTEAATTEAATTKSTATQSEGAAGAAVFAEAGCGGCHTFSAANSSGTVGPVLDGIDLSKAEIEQQVRNGGGGMPPFGDRLSDAEIAAVADFVENG